MMLENVDMDYAQKMQRCNEYVEALEEEQKKIQVFQRELPLCLELVTKAIETCRRELSGTSTSEHAQGQSDCSEQTTSVCAGPVFEEFIPIKRSSLCDEEGEHESHKPEKIENISGKKSDWLRSVQLWNPSPNSQPKEDRVAKKAKVVEVKPNSGAFQPFQKENRAPEINLQLVKATCSAPTTSSTTETGGAKSDTDKAEREQRQHQSLPNRKQRRCWSPELHRRFLHALQQLGGSHVATPKQIREHMKVDGLTNDEVKSHLQKYRLHTRRPTTSGAAHGNVSPQQPQFVVVGGIWVPSPPAEAANNSVYAPVAALPSTRSSESPQQSAERSSGRCNSPAASSSTNTTTISSHVS